MPTTRVLPPLPRAAPSAPQIVSAGKEKGHRRLGHLGSERGDVGGPLLVRPSTPSSAKGSCHHQTQVFALPVRRMI
jgi:hypothetical protein